MRLRNIDFRPVFSAAGAQGFFGEGYPYHRFWKLLGLSFKDCGFVAKTTTLHERAGNMPLRKNFVPQELKPKCIAVKFSKGITLNAVGLSGPGAATLLQDGGWQNRKGEPFFLSFMSISNSENARLSELQQFATLLKSYLPQFQTAIGLEINFSCPNTGLDPTSLISEVGQSLDVAAQLNIPLQAKFNATLHASVICEACRHEECNAITMSNTIPWGKMPERINWSELFGSDESPLAHLGGGGLSGWPLTPIVCDWIREARDCGFHKPIWACGGIDSLKAVSSVKQAGASGVQLGTVAMLRPWRMRQIIKCANEIFSS